MSDSTPPVVARALVAALLGDPDPPMPDGREAYTYFEGLPLDEAMSEYKQIHQLPEGFRQRDLVERMGEDGRA